MKKLLVQISQRPIVQTTLVKELLVQKEVRST